MTTRTHHASARSGLVTRFCLFALVGTAAALLATTADARSSNATSRLPTAAAARSIVTNLWAQREGALSILDTEILDPYEGGSALRQDRAYVNFVQCGCASQKDPHPADRVVPQIPTGSGSHAFFAEVRTTNTTSHRHPWYVVAVANTGGHWKLAFVTFGSYSPAPPLESLTRSVAYTPAETGATRARALHLAQASATQASAQDAKVRHTPYGASIHTRDVIEPAADGVFGLTLPSHKVMSCFTLHTFETYAMAQGLQQDEAQHNWSNLLAPGTYSSITLDSAVPECVVGSDAGSAPGTLRMQYDEQVVKVAGVPR